uniref:Uncharacterized protein LOC111109923 n=1 Tax=Crassostrea virginica TaxID=6565 RepID=A0A8B8BFV1_CRAVI|nr:uncharacterized protein LOC111109923 [Crassostrea virginica]
MNFLILICTCMISSALSYTCSDTYDSCKYLGKSVCEDPTYFTWAYKNCAQTCDFCRYYDIIKLTYPMTSPSTKMTTMTTTTTTTMATITSSQRPGPCGDIYNHCGVYSSACGQSQFMKDYCMHTCGECIPTLLPSIEAGKSIVFG